MALRFRVASVQNARHTDHNVIDLETQHVLATARDGRDAAFILTKLNEQPTFSVEWRPVFAMYLSDFREHLERENGGPLTSDPKLALFLDDLCHFLEFNPGETALALGAQLLVYLSFISDAPTDSIQIINSDSTLPVRDLAVGDDLRVA
jgi:hypothetical protein